jgi:predicted dithiol-disulfide oxidoreductase (DUF899 family)
MKTEQIHATPPVVSRDEWLKARKELLVREKAATRMRDEVSAQRRRLPMVRVEENYVFDGPEGKRTLVDLFEGRRLLYVHHFMWNAETETHCPGCSAAADLSFNDRLFAHLHRKDVSFAAISRAPLSKITEYKAKNRWEFPWYSSHGSVFNYDFHITLDSSVAPIEYNYRNEAELKAAGESDESLQGDRTGASMFLRKGDEVFHTYSAYARGMDLTFPVPHFLELTVYGRQEDWEDSPPGWPQQPTYG